MLGLGYTEYAYTTEPRNKTLGRRLARMFPVISHEQATYYFPKPNEELLYAMAYVTRGWKGVEQR